jgi:DNA-binding CsgD family transcriptional regulator
MLDAAHAWHAAGGSETALRLLALASTGSLDILSETRLELLRARITFHTRRGSEVPELLVQAARTLTPLDAALARDTYLDALDAALVNGGREALRVATAALAAPDAVGPPRPQDLLMDGLVTTFTAGYAEGAPTLRLAVAAFRDGTDTAPGLDECGRWLWLASRIAIGVLDDELAQVLANRHVQLAHDSGALEMLPAALSQLACVVTLTGELARARELAVESTEIAEATGAVPLRYALIMLAAWRGDRVGVARLSDLILGDIANPAGGGAVGMAQYAMAVLHNGLGNYTDARAAAERACETDEPAIVSMGLSELVEAAVRAGQPDVAAHAVAQLDARALACNTSWARGLAARSRALASTSIAEDDYREAIAQLGRSRMTGETARAHLVYGEWLRREGRRQDARDQLRTAHALLSDMGAEAFADRAARELRANGEHPRTRAARPTDALTAHEAQIARLVATGATSREVAAQLFLSPRTIEAHLRSIFRKLGITSRRQLKELRLP